MTVITLLCAFPLIYVTMASFISTRDYAAYGITFPKHFSLENYVAILSKGSKVMQGFWISVYVTVIATVLNLIFTFITSYGISKKYLPGRVGITFFMYFSMLFSGGIVPYYLLIVRLGMIDSLWSIIVPGLISPWNCFLMRNFLMALPETIEESARIDGANDFVVMARIILPLSMPVVATIGLFYAVGHWNEWFGAMIFINDATKHPLQLVLRNILTINAAVLDPAVAAAKARIDPPPNELLKMTALVVTTVPILVVYPFVQKYFVKGIIAGSIKG